MDDASLFNGDTEDIARFLVTFNEHADVLPMSAQDKIRHVADCAPPRVSQAVRFHSEYLRSYQSHGEAIAAWSALQQRLLQEFRTVHRSHQSSHEFESTASVCMRQTAETTVRQYRESQHADPVQPHRVVHCRIGGRALDAIFADTVSMNLISEELWRTDENGSTPMPSEYVHGVKTVSVCVEIAGVALQIRAHVVANAPFQVLLGQDFLRHAPVSVQWTSDSSSFLVIQEKDEEPVALARIRDVPASSSASKHRRINVTSCLSGPTHVVSHDKPLVSIGAPSSDPKWPAEGSGTCTADLLAISPRHQSVSEVESASAAPSPVVRTDTVTAQHRAESEQYPKLCPAIDIESKLSADAIGTESCPAAETQATRPQVHVGEALVTPQPEPRRIDRSRSHGDIEQASLPAKIITVPALSIVANGNTVEHSD
ncbi:hypothetical protein AURDEDRAFT_166558 [Auricularia subglabra TFB-10046 SS5]|nr:hypothetical protein AURDEDRAFT_166558 [Auricularia subglabra TFB-10046 SS5]